MAHSVTTKKRTINQVDGGLSPAPNLTKKYIQAMQHENISSEQSISPTKIIEDVKHVFDTHDRKSVKIFAKKLQLLAKNQMIKLEEIEFRETSKQNLLNSFKNLHKYQYEDILNEKQYDDMKNLMNEMVVKLRNYFDEKDIWYDAAGQHITKIKSFDIALKSNVPHPKYTNIMSELFKNTINNKDICSIICDYSHNGYRWYCFNRTWEDNEEDRDSFVNEQYGGVMFNVKFNVKDYFGNNSFQKTKSVKSGDVKLKNLRKELNHQKLNNMTDIQISFLLMAIYCIVLDLYEEMEGLTEITQDFVQLHGSNTIQNKLSQESSKESSLSTSSSSSSYR